MRLDFDFGVFYQSPVPYELEDCEIYVAYVYEYNKGPSRNFAWYSFGGPGSPQILYSGPQMSKFAVFRQIWRSAVRLLHSTPHPPFPSTSLRSPPSSSRDLNSRYLLTVWPLEGQIGQTLSPYISSYVEGRAEIFSPSYRTRPPLAIPPGLSRVQGPPEVFGPSDQIWENLTLITRSPKVLEF